MSNYIIWMILQVLTLRDLGEDASVLRMMGWYLDYTNPEAK